MNSLAWNASNEGLASQVKFPGQKPPSVKDGRHPRKGIPVAGFHSRGTHGPSAEGVAEGPADGPDPEAILIRDGTLQHAAAEFTTGASAHSGRSNNVRLQGMEAPKHMDHRS